MFQYAAGRALALANNCELKLDVSAFDEFDIHSGYALSPFNIVASIATPYDVKVLTGSSSRLVRRLRGALGITKKTHYVETDFTFDPTMLACAAPMYLEGNWQSYKYFSHVEGVIRQELTPISTLHGTNQELSKAIEQMNSVSVHIRRGDYVTSATANKVHGFVGLPYYDEALLRIKREVVEPHFFVFSDDPSWAKTHLGLRGNVTFVEHNAGANAYEDMRLMSLCKYHVMANSTFSWWGAWLGLGMEKRVYYPSNWFATNKHNTASLCPDTWTCLSTGRAL